MERVVTYNRCSTEEENQVNALAVQVAESHEIAEKNNWIVVRQYVESQSGTSANKRTEYQKLLKDLTTDEFDIVMIKSIDRLTRSIKDWYIFLDILVKNNKRLFIYIDNKFYTPEDNLILGIKAIFAEDFSRELSKKIKNAHKRRQEKQSGFNFTVPIYGWDKIDKDVYKINEEEAAYYRQAFEMARQGYGYCAISNKLYELGARTKEPKPGRCIPPAQWRQLLRSTKAYGAVAIRKTRYDFETKQRTKLPDEDWVYIEDALPPIVSKAYYDEVLAVLDSRKKVCEGKQVHKNSHSIFYNKLVCAECGAYFKRRSLTSTTGTRYIYKCPNTRNKGLCQNIKVAEDTLEKLLNSLFQQQYVQFQLDIQSIIEKVLQEIEHVISSDNKGNKKKELEYELAKLKRKKAVLFEKLMEEIISDEEFKNYNDELTTEIEEKEQFLANNIDKTEKEAEYAQRLKEIKKTLVDTDMVHIAASKEIAKKIYKIIIHMDCKMEVFFDKIKLLGLREDDFYVTMEYKHETPASIRKDMRKAKIIELMKSNADITQAQIADRLNVSMGSVSVLIRELKEEGGVSYEYHGSHNRKWIVRNSEDT